MRKHRLLLLLILLIGTLTFLAGCGAESTDLDRAGQGDRPTATEIHDIKAAQAANQILLGEGVSARGHRLYFKDVPLSVREQDLAQCLPDKELLYLMVKYDAYGDIQAIRDRMDLTMDENNPDTMLAMNRFLLEDVRAQVEAAWRDHPSLWQRIRGKERTAADFQAYLEKRQDKDKTHLYLLR